MTDNPNTKIYLLRWDNGAPYVHPRTHRTEFALDEAIRIAGYEPVSVIDPATGRVLWVGSEATRGLPTLPTLAELGPHEVGPQPGNLPLLNRLAAIHHGIADGFADEEADFEEIALEADRMITELAWELGGKR